MQCIRDLQDLTMVALFWEVTCTLITLTGHTGEEADSDRTAGHHCLPGLAQRLCWWLTMPALMLQFTDHSRGYEGAA